MPDIRITVSYGTQEDVLTPQYEPGVDTVAVQVTDINGIPLADTLLIHMSGNSGELYLFPVLIAGVREALPRIIEFMRKAIRFAYVHGGAFDEAAFIESTYAELHKPKPVIVQPAQPPSPPTPAPSGITQAEARVKIEAYAKSRGSDIGTPIGDVFQLSSLVGVYGRNYGRGGQTKDICIIVCSRDGTYLVRNDFMLNYSGGNYPNRVKLGAPIEDEHPVQGGAEQRFQKGRMFWSAATLKVEVYDLKGARINP